MTDIANIQDLAVAANTVTNVTLVQPYADNATVGTTIESISNSNVSQLIPIILGADIDITSADSNDTSAGTGARTVRITYLDANFNQASQDMVMAGTGDVEITLQTVSFIQKAEILTTGTGLTGAGAITIADVTGSAVHAIIDAGSRDSGNCMWMIPAGHTGFIHGFWADVQAIDAGAGCCDMLLQVAHFGFSGVANSETWRTVAKFTSIIADDNIVNATGGNSSTMGTFSFPGNVPFVVPEKTMVRVAALGGVTCAVTAGFSMSIQGSGAGTNVTVN